MKRRLFILLFLTLSCLSPDVQAQEMIMEIIPLQHRMTDDVVPILRPLVAPGGTITGMNNQLIIKTTPDNLAEIKNVLQSLDRSPRRLLITVKQDIGGQIHTQEHSVSGKYSSGNISIKSRDPGHSHEGVIISGKDDEGNIVRYRGLDTTSETDDENAFSVQALEGYPAFIQSGQSVPVQNRTAYVTPDGVVVNDNIEYHDATSGFYVLPRLNGDRVTLLVAPRLSRIKPGQAPVFDVQNVETTASGRLGEWIELGGIDQSFSDNSRQTLSSSRTRGQELRSVLIKVVEIK